MLDFLYARNTRKQVLKKTSDTSKMRELKRHLPIRLFLDILASGYENQFYETYTCAKENTHMYGTGFA